MSARYARPSLEGSIRKQAVLSWMVWNRGAACSRLHKLHNQNRFLPLQDGANDLHDLRVAEADHETNLRREHTHMG